MMAAKAKLPKSKKWVPPIPKETNAADPISKFPMLNIPPKIQWYQVTGKKSQSSLCNNKNTNGHATVNHRNTNYNQFVVDNEVNSRFTVNTGKNGRKNRSTADNNNIEQELLRFFEMLEDKDFVSRKTFVVGTLRSDDKLDGFDDDPFDNVSRSRRASFRSIWSSDDESGFYHPWSGYEVSDTDHQLEVLNDHYNQCPWFYDTVDECRSLPAYGGIQHEFVRRYYEEPQLWWDGCPGQDNDDDFKRAKRIRCRSTDSAYESGSGASSTSG